MFLMVKKEDAEKRTIQIKFLVTDEEHEKINNYARRYFQSKSDFIRSAILDRILQFDRLTLPQQSDPRFKDKELITSVRKDLTAKLIPDEEKEGIILNKPDESEIKRIQEEREHRKQELEKELANIKKQIKE